MSRSLVRSCVPALTFAASLAALSTLGALTLSFPMLALLVLGGSLQAGLYARTPRSVRPLRLLGNYSHDSNPSGHGKTPLMATANTVTSNQGKVGLADCAKRK